MKSFKLDIIEVLDDMSSSLTTNIPPGVALIAAQKMWADTKGRSSVVAVVDTGIDNSHPDLAANVIDGADFSSGILGKDFIDKNGHGTHVAGIIAANGSIFGVAPEAKLIAVKVLNEKGQGSFTNIARGLNWARNWQGSNGEKVNVINMSLGGPLSHAKLYDEIKKCVAQGIIIICAAGNSGDGDPETIEISYPAYYPECVAIGAVDLNSGVANFSNSNKQIAVVAPGVETYSTYLGGKYVKLSGTSMAAPHVSGAVALINARFNKKFGFYPSPAYVREMLDYLAIDLGQLGYDSLTGYGLFSFNLNGGKSYKFFVGQEKYLVNNKEQQLKMGPFIQEGEVCMALEEMSDLFDAVCDIPPDTDKADVWV